MLRECGRKRHFLQPGHAADEARQRMIGQIIFIQAAAAVADCLESASSPRAAAQVAV
jgi:hypothetical protein